MACLNCLIEQTLQALRLLEETQWLVSIAVLSSRVANA